MESAPQAVDDRLVDLEIRLAHQDAAIEQLTRQLLDSEREVRMLLVRIEHLEHQLRSLGTTEIAAPQEETPPPHY